MASRIFAHGSARGPQAVFLALWLVAAIAGGNSNARRVCAQDPFEVEVGRATSVRPSSASTPSSSSALDEEDALESHEPRLLDRDDSTPLERPRTQRESNASRAGAAAPEVKIPTAETPLAEVRIEGNVTIQERAISRHIKTRPGRPYDGKQVREDIKALLATRWFASVDPLMRPTDEGPVLIFRVVEKPIVQKVEYQGNKKIKTKQLAAITGIKRGSPYDISANRESSRRIEQHYHEKGYPFATVELAKGNSSDEREVIFQINEGPRVRVTSISYHGNDAVSGQVLNMKLKTKKAVLWYFGGNYDASTVPDDIAAIKKYYQDIGYFDVQVQDKVSTNDDRSRIYIEYFIDEGQRYKVANVEFRGQRVFTVDQLRERLNLTKGEYFSSRYLNKDVDKINDMYFEQGRLFARVEAVPRFLEEPGTADLVYTIDEDRPYYIGKINVHILGDAGRSKRSVVLNNMTFASGELANRKKIDFSKRKLAGSGYFEREPGKEPRIDIKPVLKDPKDAERYALRGQNIDDFSARGSEIPWPEVQRFEMLPDAEDEMPKVDDDVEGADHGANDDRQTCDDNDGARCVPHNRARGLVQTSATRPIGRLDRSGLRAATLTVQTPTVASNLTPFADDSHEFSREVAFTPQAHLAGDAEIDFVDANADDSEPAAGVEYGLDLPIFPPGDLMETAFFVQPPTPEEVHSREPLVRGQNFEDGFPDRGDLMQGGSPLGDPLYGPGQADIDIYVNEARTGRLMFGVGVNSDAGVVGSVILNENNFDIARFPTSFDDLIYGNAFRGAGQRFRLELVPGSTVSRYLVSWSDPYFLNSNYSVGVNGFYYQRFFDDWDEQRAGGRIQLGRQLTQQWSIASALRLEEVEISEPNVPTPSLLADVLGSNFLSTVRFSVAHDTRDSPFIPGEGHFVEAAYEQGFGDFVYPRAEAEARQFFTLYSRPDGMGRHILSVGGNLGWTDSGTPIFERYYAGGFQTFRGFQFRGVSPRQLGTRVGGRWMMLGSVEYLFPMLANETIQGVAFSDLGTVEEDVGLEDFRVTVGLGLRVTIPAMGPVPLAFDFAVPLAKEDEDDTRVFSFYVGFTR